MSIKDAGASFDVTTRLHAGFEPYASEKVALGEGALSRRICVGLVLAVLFLCGAHAVAKFWIGGDAVTFVHFYRAAGAMSKGEDILFHSSGSLHLSAASRVHLSTANCSFRADGGHGLDCDQCCPDSCRNIHRIKRGGCAMAARR